MPNPLIVNPYANKKYTKAELAAIPDLRPKIGEAGKGIRAFADETQAAGYGVYALGAQHLKDLTGGSDDGFLAGQVKAGQEGYARNIEEATAGRQAPNIARVEDIKGIGGAFDWGVYNLAKGVPQVVALAGPAGVGGAVAKGLVKKSVKNAAKNAVTKEMRAEATGQIRKSVGRGAMAGGFAGGFALEGGHQMGQMLEEGIDPSKAKVAATVYAGIAGALEFAAPFVVARSLGRGDFAKKSIREIIKNDPKLAAKAVALAAMKEAGQRGGKGALLGAGVEGVTEGLQELTSIAAMRWAKDEPLFADLTDEDWSGIRNSMSAGALVGFGLGGTGGVVAGPQKEAEAEAMVGPVAEAAAVTPIPPVVPPVVEPPVENVPGTEGVTVGDPTLTPMFDEFGQPVQAGPPVQAVARPPGLEQKPLQGELMDDVTGTEMVPQGEQAQLNNPYIDGRLSPEEQLLTEQQKLTEQGKIGEQLQITEQKKLTEQRKLPAPDNKTYIDNLGVRVKDMPMAKGLDAGIADNLQVINDAGTGKPFKTVESSTLESTARPPMWHSKVQQTVATSPQAKMQGKQWLGWLGKQPGVKPEEIEDLGLKEWLDTKEGAVSKEEVAEFVKAGGVQLEEVINQSAPINTPEQIEEFNENAGFKTQQDSLGGYYITNLQGEVIRDSVKDRNVALAQAFSEAKKINPINPREYEEADLSLPGGKEHKEWLLKIPSKHVLTEVEQQKLNELRERMEDFDIVLSSIERAELLKLTEQEGKVGSDLFTDTHYTKGEGAVVTLRTAEHEDTDGGRILLVDEVQSQWHQEGQDKGYRPDEAKLEAEEQKLAAIPIEQLTEEQYNRKQELFKILEFGQGLSGTVPNAPLKTAWSLLGMKRMIAHAVENGFDKVAWTIGQVHKDRYPGLVQDISKVDVLFKPGKSSPSYEITRYDREGFEINDGILHISAKELPEYIGKDLAAEVIQDYKPGKSKSYSDLNLEVGGEFFEKLYDNHLPRQMNKYFKQQGWGVKVELGDVGVKQDTDTAYHTKQEYMWTFPITQQMKDDVLTKGQPLYSEPKNPAATTHTAARFEHDFSSMFGRGIFKQALDSGVLTLNETSPEGSPAGLFNKETNQITLNLDRVGLGETPMSVLLHEGRHAGMQEVLGESLPLFHQDLLNLAAIGNVDAQSSITRSTGAVADKLGIEHGLYDLGLPQSELEAEVKLIRKAIEETEQGVGLLLEEDLAYYIQDAANTIDLAAPGLYRRILNALKLWWAQSAVGQMFAQAGLRMELTPEMAVELAKAATRRVVDGQGGIQGEGVLASELESMPNPIGAIKRWWGDSADTPLDANNVSQMEKFRAHIIDNLATIDEKSTDVHKVAEVVKSKTSADQSTINRLYTDPLVKLAIATGLNLQQLDEWLLARHVLLDDENLQNTQKRSWMTARDLAKSMPNLLRTELDERRLSLTRDQVWIDKEGLKHKIPKAQVPDYMIKLVDDYFGRMQDLADAGALNPKFMAWEDQQADWIKIQAHSAGLYSPGKVDANGQLLPGQPRRANPSNAPNAFDIYRDYQQDKDQWDALQLMAKKWDEMTAYQLDLLVEGGRIGEEEALAMKGAHGHYVKTRRKSADNDKGFEFLKSHGIGGGKPKVRAGTIEYDPVVHVMQNTLTQAHANAAAAQQNQAARYLYDEVQGNKKHWDGWFTTHQAEVHHLDTFGFLHDRVTSRPEEFDIPVTVMSENGKSGKTIYIRAIPQNQKAKLFAAGFNQLGAQQQGVVAKVLGLGNKIVRNMAVTFSPAFLAANIFRDPATALYNLQATEGKDYTHDFLMGIASDRLRPVSEGGSDSKGKGRAGLGSAWKILNSVYTDRDKADPQHVAWVEEWEHAGGRQSFTQALKEMDEGWKSFERKMAIASTPVISHAANVLGWVEKYNIIVENVSRFSAYSTVMEAWERGDIPKWKSKEQAQREAAIISKELTTNFDRKGFSSQAIGLWHLFFNATVQGNTQVLRNMIKSKKLQKVVGGTVAASVMFDLLGRAFADDDDEGRNEWDNIPDYIKDRNIILPFKIGGLYVKIPAPWVYNSFWRMGGILGELSADKRDMASVPVDMGLLAMNTFNPMQSASLLQSLSPTALDPFVQAVENKNFAGNPIKPTSFPGAAALPESQLYGNSTHKAYVGLAQTLNALTGGDVAKSGFIDISPGAIHNYVNFFTAGVGKAAGQVYELGALPFNDKEFEVKGVPILSTYAIAPGSQVDVQLYHDRVAQVLQAQKAVDLYGKGKTRDIEKQRESRIKYVKELRMVSQVKDVERQLKSIRVRIRAAQGRKDTKRVEALKKNLISVQQKFNKAYERRMK